MLYLDTSLLVAAFTYEDATDRAIDLLKSTPGRELMVSEWVKTEFMAALSTKVRTKQIDDIYRTRASTLFAISVEGSMEVAAVTTTHFRAAAELAEEHKLGLRAGDALHLAIARERDAALCTLDKRLARAGKALGIATKLI
jgi:hypothetical protein